MITVSKAKVQCQRIEDFDAYKNRKKGSLIENFIAMILNGSDIEEMFPDGVEPFINQYKETFRFLSATLEAIDIVNPSFQKICATIRDNSSNVEGILIDDIIDTYTGFNYGDCLVYEYCTPSVCQWLDEYRSSEFLQDAYFGVVTEGMFLEEFTGHKLYLLRDKTFLLVQYVTLTMADGERCLLGNQVPIQEYNFGSEYESAEEVLEKIIEIIG